MTINPYWNKGKLLLNVDELAELLGISPRTIYNGTTKNARIKFGIPYIRVGKLLRFHTDDVVEYLEKSRSE